MVLRQQVAQVAQAFGDHVEHRAAGVLWHFLGHACDHHAVLQAHFAVVRRDFAGQQPHQCGFSRAIAAHDADALVGFQGQVDVFQEERAADAEVDALQLHE